MYLDARYENVREGGIVRSCAVLIAIGVSESGGMREVADRLRAVLHATDEYEAKRLLDIFIVDYQKTAPKLAAWAEGAIPEGLVVLQMPKSHRWQLHTNNMLERLNKEIKKRTRVASIFPNTESCLRLVSAVAMETSEDWGVGKKYLNMC